MAATRSRNRKSIMGYYTFYPSDDSEAQANIPEAEVAGERDEFGCIETPVGLYIYSKERFLPAPKQEAETGPYTDIFGQYHPE